MPNAVINRRIIGSPNATIDRLLAEALIPGRDGIVTALTTATPDPINGGTVPANTVNGRNLRIGSRVFPLAALLAQRATTGVYGAFTSSFGLSSYTVAAGAYPSVRTAVEDLTTANHGPFGNATTLTDGVNYVFSAYVKRGSGTRNVQIQMQQGGNGFAAQFDLSSLTVSSFVAFGTGSSVRASVRILPTGFAFIQMTGSASAWGGSVSPSIYALNGIASNYTGDGTSSLIISGYQVEQGEYATSPLAWDGGAGLTRAAASYSWNQALNTANGTMIIQRLPYGHGGAQGASAGRLYDANSNGLLQYNAAAQTFTAQRTDNVAALNAVTSAVSVPTAGNIKNIIHFWDSSNNSIMVDGNIVSSSAPSLPYAAGTPIFIGNRSALDQSDDSWVAPILFNRRLSIGEASLVANAMVIA